MPEWKCTVKRKKKEVLRWVYGPQTSEAELKSHFAATEPDVEFLSCERIDLPAVTAPTADAPTAVAPTTA